jgi:hypothetical protein
MLMKKAEEAEHDHQPGSTGQFMIDLTETSETEAQPGRTIHRNVI